MTVVNFNYPKFKYTIASTGQPGAGYKLFTYEEGTSTKKTTWTSLAKTATNTNPIILDANGEADVWIDGNYKFVLALPTDTDPPTSPVWTYDAIRSTEEVTTATTAVATPTNGSFEVDDEADGEPDDWTIAVLSGGTIAIDSTSSSHGGNSLKFTSTGSGGGSASTDGYYEVEAGKVIGVRFSIISANVDTLNKVEVYWYDKDQAFLSSTAVYNEGAANPTSWTRYYKNTAAPALAKYARIVLTGVDAASTFHSTTNFDNVELDTLYTGELSEFAYLEGVTSSIQTQLDSKAVPADIADLSGVTDTATAITNLGLRGIPVDLLYLGTGADGSKTVAASENLASGEYHYTNLTINISQTLGISDAQGYLILRCTGTATITGDISADGKGGAAGTGAAGVGGDGFAGGGGGSGAGFVSAGGDGGDGFPGSGAAAAGGGFPVGGNDGTLPDRYVRVYRTTPTSWLIGNAYLGGGGGGASDGGITGGAGGGGIIVIADTINFTGNVTADGDTSSTNTTQSGGAGGGGIAILAAANYTASSGTITATGGTAAAATYQGGDGAAGIATTLTIA